jgi:AhpD family alkylhydroperoxidase
VKHKTVRLLAVVLLAGLGWSPGQAEDPALTRPEMKARLEALKGRTSRIPLPPPTAEELASGKSLVNNGRLRSLYLPPSWNSWLIPGWGGSRNVRGGTAAALSTLQQQPDYAFKTRVFWVVSRTNDCQYCLGHQELKLKRAGMTDSQIAALDVQWDLFPAAEQAAMRAARKLTIAPHRFGKAELQDLLGYFDDARAIDLLYTIARYNAVNRWTSATGIPQDQQFGSEENSELDTPTAEEWSDRQSAVAPLDVEQRPDWEPQAVFEERLQEARRRQSPLALPAIETATVVLAKDTPAVIPPQWFRAISGLPVAVDAWAQRQALLREGRSPQQLRLLISWITARENRAWYAAAHARARLLASGFPAESLESFDELLQAVPAEQQIALRFARLLTSHPQQVADADVAALREHFSDFEVAEIIHVTADANAFDRLTESLQLQLEF